jgi:peptidyl-prolyl cis-trans isomerase SurA
MKKHFIYAALILVGAVTLYGMVAGEVVERIAAVVGNRAILASEVANQLQLVMMQAGPNAQLDPKQVAHDLLEQMVNDELILSAAREDTTITATPEEIQSALDEHMASLIARFPSEDAFLDQLSREGWTKRSYEKRLRSQIKEQVLKQKIISKKLSNVSVSRQEVEQFYKKNADSLPPVPTTLRLAHILVAFKVSEHTADSVKQLAERARSIAVDSSMKFADVAAQFPGAVGGRIGYVKKDELVPEFARAAFALQPGSISGPVRTVYGWHIIKSFARTDDSVDVSQMLFPLQPSVSDSARAKALVDSLYQAIEDGADFREVAKVYSDDSATRATGGEMEATSTDNLRPEFQEALSQIQTGQIAPPVISALGYHILRLIDRTPGHTLTLENDYDLVKKLAVQEKTAELVDDWVADLKKKVYVDIRDVDLFTQ